MAPADNLRPLPVIVAYSAGPRELDLVELSLPAGSTAMDALNASGLLARHGLGSVDQVTVGIWMKLRPLDTLLRPHDRVEIYRPLKVDPKEARRQRYRKNKA